MNALENLTTEMTEWIGDHFGLDSDEVAELEHVELTTDSVSEIEGRWHQHVTDLSHLSRDEKQAVLQRAKPFRPRIVDGREVRLYDEVQVAKGQQRIKAVVIDLADERFVATY